MSHTPSTALALVIVACFGPSMVAAQDTSQGSEVPPPPPAGTTQPQPQQTQPQQQQVYVAQPVSATPYGQLTPAQQQQPAASAQEPRMRIGLVISGAVLLGASWLIHAAIVSPFAGWSIDSGDDPDWDEFRVLGAVPIAGPWIQLAVKPTAALDDSWSTYLVVNGLMQAAGVTMFILGLTLRSKPTSYAANEPSLMIGPMASGEGAGLSAFGRF